MDDQEFEYIPEDKHRIEVGTIFNTDIYTAAVALSAPNLHGVFRARTEEVGEINVHKSTVILSINIVR